MTPSGGKKGSTRPTGFKSAQYGYRRTTPGGAGGHGTVSSLFVGSRPKAAEGPGPKAAKARQRPFVQTLPVSGKLGAAVKILGANLTGATSVSFNGAAAVFKVVSDSLITTAVPLGATTGKVKVVTPPPSGTLASSNVFWVLE